MHTDPEGGLQFLTKGYHAVLMGQWLRQSVVRLRRPPDRQEPPWVQVQDTGGPHVLKLWLRISSDSARSNMAGWAGWSGSSRGFRDRASEKVAMIRPWKQQSPKRTAGSRTQGLADRKDGASRILFGWSPAVVTYTPLRARLARSQGKYLCPRWPYRDSNPSYGYDHVFAIGGE